MEPSPVKIVACFVIFAVIGTEAMNYMAFPRLGRSGYLAFPRLGRSDGQTIQSSEFEQAECCPEGIKSHWIIIGASKPEIRSRCSPKSVCCEGLEELVGRSSDHIFYTKCTKITDEKTENTVLDRLLRKS
ncbi:hypothetical protein LOTGIDRAFT_149279 [Lottia gigantea]|uniref:Uncharacterized protein n=1 Tax=Lottia gigantea TaxID=225164 RepID=V4ACU1_LOTGI|nr:hypothetical protein LOTGIDRAFT_149279 [Lottia gigantea]ESO91141.1 hypothetical protein LOTGIDRAFT_149279 [Lottia gigantea]